MTVTEIEAMDRATLVATWTDVLRAPVPKGLSKALMRPLARDRDPEHGNLAACQRGPKPRSASRRIRARGQRAKVCNRAGVCCANGTA